MKPSRAAAIMAKSAQAQTKLMLAICEKLEIDVDAVLNADQVEEVAEPTPMELNTTASVEPKGGRGGTRKKKDEGKATTSRRGGSKKNAPVIEEPAVTETSVDEDDEQDEDE